MRKVDTVRIVNGQVIRDWTKSTLTMDMVNSMGEVFHFEIEPGEGSSDLPSRQTASPGQKNFNERSVIVHCTLPIAKA